MLFPFQSIACLPGDNNSIIKNQSGFTILVFYNILFSWCGFAIGVVPIRLQGYEGLSSHIMTILNLKEIYNETG